MKKILSIILAITLLPVSVLAFTGSWSYISTSSPTFYPTQVFGIFANILAPYFTATSTTASTFPNASTTNLTIGTSGYITPLTSTVLAVDQNHKIIATTTFAGTVTNVTGSGNISSSGGTTPNITFTGVLPIANGGTNTGAIGASSTVALSDGTKIVYLATSSLGISGGSGTVTSVGLSSPNSSLTIGSTPVTTSGTITGDLNLGHSNTWSVNQLFDSVFLNMLYDRSSTVIADFSGGGRTLYDASGVSAINFGSAASMALPGYATNGFLKTSSVGGALSVDTNSYLTTASAASTYVPYSGATGNVDLGANKLTVTNASTTNLTVGTNTYLTGLTGTVLAVDNNHKIIATTTGSGTVTSVAMTTPTGLTVSGSPITGAGTLALTLTAGYNIPLTASTTQWASAYASTSALSATSPITYTGSTGVIACPTCVTSNYWTQSGATTTNTVAKVASTLGVFGTIEATSTTGTSTFANALKAALYLYPDGSNMSGGSSFPFLYYPGSTGTLANYQGKLFLPTGTNVIDSTGSGGSAGMVLINSTSTGYAQWVATSTLGISGGGTNFFSNSSASTTLTTGTNLIAGLFAAPYFFATSTTATSSFAGAVLVGASSTASTTFTVDVNGHVLTGGNVPTCGTGCSSLTGDDGNMAVVTGSSVSSSVVNFASTWVNSRNQNITPVCHADEETGGVVTVNASSTPTTVTLNFASALTSITIGVSCQASDNFIK